MTDIALNGHEKSLSMTDVAIRRRASRYGLPVSVYREMGAGHVPRLSQEVTHKVTPKATGSPSLDIRLATSRAGPSCDASRVNKTMSHVTQLRNQGLKLVSPSAGNGVTVPHVAQSPPLQSGQSLVSDPVARPGVDWTLVTLRLLATVAFVTGLGSNGTFLVNQGQSWSEIAVLIGFAFAFDGAVAIIPRATIRMWGCGGGAKHSIVAVLVWTICLVVSALAALGFANKSMGDTAAGRSAATNMRTVIDSELTAARAERGKLSFAPTDPIQIKIAEELKTVACNTNGHNYSPAKCDAKRAVLSDLAKNRKIEETASSLDTRISALTTKLADAAPAVSAAPQADAAVMVVGQFSRGVLVLQPKDVLSMHYFGFIFLPMLAGFMFAWVEVLSERRKA